MEIKAEIKTEKNLGNGNIFKLYLKLAVPSVIAQLVSMLYNIVDRIYIGHIPEIGSDALTGVGLFLPVQMLLNAFALLPGGASLAAIAMGQGDTRKAEKIMGNCFSLLIIFAAVLTMVFFVVIPFLMPLFGASEVTFPYAVGYSRICILGSIFVLIVLGMNPFITTQGFAKVSMLTTILGATINIVLDPLFIFGLKMGVEGAALATVLSQAVGGFWVMFFLKSEKTYIRLRKENYKFEREIVLPCIALGISAFVMMVTESLLSVSFNTNLFRYGGDLAVGAMTIVSSVSQLIIMPLQGFCQGGQPIISFNFGAGNSKRVKTTFLIQFFVCVCYAGLFCLLSLVVPEMFTSMFTNDAQLAKYASETLRIYMAGMCGFGAQMACQQTIMALGKAKISLFLACLRKLILLIPLVFVLPLFCDNKVFGVFFAEPISDLIAATVTTIVFLRCFPEIMRKGEVWDEYLQV